jgi:competence protein ComGC
VIGAETAPICDHGGSSRGGTESRRAFTLIDVLVSMAVVAVLIGILLPSLSAVRETTRRVICSSNVRQQGYGIALYADDHNDVMPPSRFAPLPGAGEYHPEMTTTVRRAADSQGWDGLGWLFEMGYLAAAGVYYCPSHSGDHPLSRYAEEWYDGSSEELVSNYQYRGYRYREHGIDRGFSRLTDLAVWAPRVALVSDALRTRFDFNHRVGSNLLRADLGVAWFPDHSGLADGLPENEADADAIDKIIDAWGHLDGPG